MIRASGCDPVESFHAELIPQPHTLVAGSVEGGRLTRYWEGKTPEGREDWGEHPGSRSHRNKAAEWGIKHWIYQPSRSTVATDEMGDNQKGQLNLSLTRQTVVINLGYNAASRF